MDEQEREGMGRKSWWGLDDAPFGLQPEAEIWIKRREPWLAPVGGASQHEENRN